MPQFRELDLKWHNQGSFSQCSPFLVNNRSIFPSSRCTHHHSGASGDSGGCWHHSCAQLSGGGWAYPHDRVVPPGAPPAGQWPLLQPVQRFPPDQQCPEGGHSWIWMCGQKLARISAGQGHSHCTRWALHCGEDFFFFLYHIFEPASIFFFYLYQM